MYNKRALGKQYEESARKFLEQKGYLIQEMNFRCRSGEIDIIAREKEYLVFIEVKYRSSKSKGYPQEAVDYYKRKKITETARYYMHIRRISVETPCRFDVVGILDEDLKLIQDAFDAV